MRDLGDSSKEELACSQDQVVMLLYGGSQGVLGSQDSCRGYTWGLGKPCQIQLCKLDLVGETDPFLFGGLGEA